MQSLLAKGLALLLMVGGLFPGSKSAPQPQTSAKPTPVTVSGPSIRYGVLGEFESFDPVNLWDSNAQVATTQLFEGLVRMTAKGPVPGMAERWEVSTDGITYRFYLREGLRWSNGDPLTTSDFVYAWERALNQLLAPDYDGDLYLIKGADALRAIDPRQTTAYAAARKALGVNALDARTLEVTLETPAPYFLGLTAYGSFRPVPKRVVEANPDGWAMQPEKLVSNGPFTLASWDWDQAVFVKNPYYWNQSAVKLESLVMWNAPDQNTALKAFEVGELDVLNVSPVVDTTWLPKEARSTGPLFRSTYFDFNTTVKPFDDPRVRRALALSLDRKALLAKGVATNRPLYGVVPTGAPGATPEMDFRTTTGNLLREDVAEARRLLAEAGYPDGKGFPSVELLTNPAGVNEAVALAAQQSWQQNLGISVKVTVIDFTQLLKRRQEGKFSIYRIGWSGGELDAVDFLNLWASTNTANVTGYSNPAFDALIERAKATGDQHVRVELMRQAETLLLRDMPSIPLYETMGNYLQAPKVTGLYWHPQMGVDFTGAAIK